MASQQQEQLVLDLDTRSAPIEEGTEIITDTRTDFTHRVREGSDNNNVEDAIAGNGSMDAGSVRSSDSADSSSPGTIPVQGSQVLHINGTFMVPSRTGAEPQNVPQNILGSVTESQLGSRVTESCLSTNAMARSSDSANSIWLDNALENLIDLEDASHMIKEAQDKTRYGKKG